MQCKDSLSYFQLGVSQTNLHGLTMQWQEFSLPFHCPLKSCLALDPFSSKVTHHIFTL